MFSNDLFQRFLQDAPFSVLFQATLQHCFADGFLDDLFQRTAPEQHNRQLCFSHVVGLLAPVVLRIRKSVRAAYLARQDIPVTLADVYIKLQGIEPAVCEALVREVAQRAPELIDTWPKARRPDPVPGLRLRTVDGNYLAGTQHRLVPLRDCGAAALPEMTVVLRDDRTGLLNRVHCCPDGHTNERALLERVLEWIEADDLVLGDRAYCTLDFFAGLSAARLVFDPAPQATALSGVDPTAVPGSNRHGPGLCPAGATGRAGAGAAVPVYSHRIGPAHPRRGDRGGAVQQRRAAACERLDIGELVFAPLAVGSVVSRVDGRPALRN
jgi:hypothetical protein